MPATINVNSRTVVHKTSNGTSVAFPDVCKTPTGGGPVPIPYPNVAISADTAMGAKSVTMDRNPPMLKGSNFSKSSGDEPGSVGGVVSGVNKGKAEFINYSFDVMIEGKNVPRLGDMMLHNKGGSFNSPPTAEIQPPLPPAALNPVDPEKEEKSEIKLKSTYAHDQLTLLAKDLSETTFIVMLRPIFGDDIPIAGYSKLYRALSTGALPNPEIQVLKSGIHGHYAAFNSKTQKILVIDFIANESGEDEEQRQILFVALVEEYGHYIDWVLRNKFSRVGGDAKDDEGAIYSYRMAYIDMLKNDKLHFADLEGETYSGPLTLDVASAKAGAEKYASMEEQSVDGKLGNYEFFGAGLGDGEPGSYGHQSIELALANAGFDKKLDLHRIYFGNWLRDFSQLIDPSVVRPSDAFLGSAQAKYTTKIPAFDTNKLSRKALTKLVGILALQEFSKIDAQFGVDVRELLHSDKGMEILGGYRPQEHIDNPKPSDATNASLIDPVFMPPPIAAQLAINPITGLKNYIATSIPGQSFPSAVEYMAERFSKAMTAGYNNEGLRYFGEGLHVLEDFFSHSNFIEVSFIKLGYTKVQPWVDVPSGAKRIPIVTGCFGRTDVVASVGPKMAEIIPHEVEDYKSIKPKERTSNDKVILIILEDLKESQTADTTQQNQSFLGKKAGVMLEWYNEYLNLRDQVNGVKTEKHVEEVFIAKHNAVGHFLVALNFVSYTIFSNTSHLVDDLQTATMGKQGTDPTHSQLAKDHDVHHFHEIAAEIAKIAVEATGKAMFNYWKKNDRQANPIDIAKSFIVHPLDNKNTKIDEFLKSWAVENPKNMQRAKFKTIYEHAGHEGMEKVGEAQHRATNWINRYKKLTVEISDFFSGK